MTILVFLQEWVTFGPTYCSASRKHMETPQNKGKRYKDF